MTIDKGYEVERLSLTVDEEFEDVIDIIAVPDNPDVVGFDAPEGSLGLSKSGRAYRKIGPLGIEWSAGASVGSVSQVTFQVPFCLANGSSSNIDLVSGQVPFKLANGSSSNIELVTS